MPTPFTRPTQPRRPEVEKAPGPRSDPHHPAWASVPQARNWRKGVVAVCAAVFAVLALAAIWSFTFKVTPILAEKLLIVALFSKVPPVQRVAIEALQDYPTRHAAVALVAFINLKNLQQVPDPEKPETPEDRARRRERRKRDLELAERATLTLCLLTGQSFGTYFKLEPRGYSWGTLSEDRWPAVLWEIDTWALRVFGPADLPLLPVLPGAPPQPVETPPGGQPR